MKHFKNNIKDDYFFNESSLDESINNIQNNNIKHLNNYNIKDDIYDIYNIFFPKNNKEKKIKRNSFIFNKQKLIFNWINNLFLIKKHKSFRIAYISTFPPHNVHL